MDGNVISDDIKKATAKELAHDEHVQEICDLESQIQKHESEIRILRHVLDLYIKQRPPVSIKWRESIKWCLEIDSENWRFFLKTVSGVYKCIAYKHKVELTPDIKNKIAVTLSALFKEKVIGRVLYNGKHLYGLPKFFNDDLIELKEEHKNNLDKLIL